MRFACQICVFELNNPTWKSIIVIIQYNKMDVKYLLVKLEKDAPLSLVHQLARSLKWMMATGEIKEGEALPNIREFADALGIHMHTVRAAYHLMEDSGLVTIKPRAGTRAKAYVPFQGALEDHSPHQFAAVLVPMLTDFYNQIMAGMTAILEAEDLIPVVIPCREDPYFANSIFKTLSAGNYCGIINISIGFDDDFALELRWQITTNTPIVFVDDFLDFGHRIDFNTSGAIHQLTTHLGEHGYRKIALISCPGFWPIGSEVRTGYAQALEDLGLEVDESLCVTVPTFTFEAGKFCVERMLAQKKLPDAIVAASDTLALGAIASLKAAGLQIPRDIAVVGYNDIAYSKFSDPPLTTAVLPAYKIGVSSAKMLLRILKGGLETWQHEQFDSELIVRRSCGC